MTLRAISENKNALSATLLYKVAAFGFVGSIRFCRVRGNQDEPIAHSVANHSHADGLCSIKVAFDASFFSYVFLFLLFLFLSYCSFFSFCFLCFFFHEEE